MVSKLEIDEDAGELLCDKCEGRGTIAADFNESMLATPCSKCQGRGKVDWVSHITGVPKPKDMFSFTASTSSFYTGSSGNHAHDDAIDAITQNLANKIDEEILESIVKGSNKNIKLYDQEVHQFDNGIVSKLLLHTDIE